MTSILETVKKMLGIDSDDESFDVDIITCINAAILSLTQIGVGSEDGFAISDENEEWSDFVDETDPQYEAVKAYVYLRVRIMFDPPSNSTLMDAINNSISELEWRLNLHAEGGC